MPEITAAPKSQFTATREKAPAAAEAVLELRVRNHPGALSHITGLFARRAFNLDAVVCVPLADGATSRMLLLVSEAPRLAQLERQLARLYDVLSIRHRPDLGADYFTRLGET
jgi:acetolactate synthase-1/3 small subunit